MKRENRWFAVIGIAAGVSIFSGTVNMAGAAEEIRGTVPNVPAEATTVPGSDFKVLQQMLESRGWRIERDAEGNTLLFPTGGEQAVAPTDQIIPATEINRVQNLLETRGWRVERDAQGNTLLFPTGGRETTTLSGETAPEAGPSSDRLIPASEINRVQGLLESRGWRVERDAQGNTLLFPTGGRETTTLSGEAAAEAGPSTDRIIPVSEINRLQGLLESRGWRVEREVGGNVLLFPISKSQKPSMVYRSWLLPPVTSGRLELPVDTWHEARLLANAWLKTSSGTGLTVGKIRKINWIYLISVVDKEPPHGLANQLVIKSKDGRVLALFTDPGS